MTPYNFNKPKPKNKMRRKPTAEQKEAAARRREQMREIAKRISQMSEGDRLTLARRAGIRTIEDRELSVFNQCFLITQNAGVSVVGGFHQWKNAGRAVMKKERWPDTFPSSLCIWCPAKPKAAPDAGELDGDGEKMRFFLGTVFDISQTADLAEANGDAAETPYYRANKASIDALTAEPKPADVTEGEFQAL